MKEKNNEINENLDGYYRHFDNSDYSTAISYLNRMEFNKKDSAWIYAKLGECYYELKNYQKAIYYCKLSLNIQKKYPLSLWTLGNSYYYEKKYLEAISIFHIITKMTEIEIGKVETQMGKSWARSLIMDSYLELSDCFYMIHKDKEAIDNYLIFKKIRQKRTKTYLPKWYINDMAKKINDISIQTS